MSPLPRPETATAAPPPSPEPDLETERQLDWVVASDDGGQAKVIVHNDDVTNHSQGYCLLELAAYAPKQVVMPRLL